MVASLVREITLRKDEFINEKIATIYFGGGTPSILPIEDINKLVSTIYENYNVIEKPEITLEANPDDLMSVSAKSETIFEDYKYSGINRLSIGIQSFLEKDLKLMNRVHKAEEARKCLSIATTYFDNISIDLIYGIPSTSNQEWRENIRTALSFKIPHISGYALTIEPKTALESLIKKGVIDNINDEVAQEQFFILTDELDKAGFIHYELSNFAKEDFFSKNNSACWQGKKYIGIGPSAHSFNGKERSWNITNNIIYIKKIQQGILPNEMEKLTVTDRYNEYVMTSLRTVWGLSLKKINSEFGVEYLAYTKAQANKFILEGLLYIENETLKTTRKGKFLTDGIASNLFKLNLN